MPYPVSAARGGKSPGGAAFSPMDVTGLVGWFDAADPAAVLQAVLPMTWPA